ncbi:MAG: hypothetical protein KKE62_11695 [Proteobacteria bacterium]|nr:hypothetical protein [Pseudomonadota bacterium]MBU1388940.1 hypothetical protein [Pseudomonadota bacterium]MBU1543492.1 hypothetical protein [Pseudomonadota bacterium]MBU2430766.1 hypothetical protein [Pseudomonadota bacterium]MBU2482631.1 hypothetical protein [Pseudomonadota bacterium]
MISGINISTSEMVIRPGESNKKIANFIKGQTLSATVLSGSSKGKAQLMINGQQVEAKTSMLLTAGQEVELKVLQEKDEVILKLIGPVQKISTNRLSALIGFFSKTGSAADILGGENKNAEMLLHELALKSEKADPRFLPRLMQKGGMALENKLARIFVDNPTMPEIKTALENLLSQDLKGSVLKHMLGGAQGTGSEAYRAISGFVDTLESFQMLNHTNSDSGRFLLPFPVFSDNSFQFGQLLIDTGQKNAKEGDGAENLIRISFLLDMTRLGPMRADFSILKKDITGQFLFQDDQTCDYVKSMIGDLKKRLSGLEYTVHRLECKTAQKEEIQETCLLEPLMKSRGNQVLNIII